MNAGPERWPSRCLFIASFALFVLWPVGLLLAQQNEAGPLIAELTTIVEHHGWPAEMGRMCAALKLGKEDGCQFKQMAVSEKPAGTVDNYAINVPLPGTSATRNIVMFHVDPAVGHFFVVSHEGALQAAFVRTKGIDYKEISIEEARPAFEASIAFWKRTMPKLNELIARGAPSAQ